LVPVPGACAERVVADPTKFFGFELGALTKVEAQADRYIVNGKHEAEDMAKVLDQFIEKYVLCGVRPLLHSPSTPRSAMMDDHAASLRHDG